MFIPIWLLVVIAIVTVIALTGAFISGFITGASTPTLYEYNTPLECTYIDSLPCKALDTSLMIQEHSCEKCDVYQALNFDKNKANEKKI